MDSEVPDEKKPICTLCTSSLQTTASFFTFYFVPFCISKNQLQTERIGNWFTHGRIPFLEFIDSHSALVKELFISPEFLSTSASVTSLVSYVLHKLSSKAGQCF